MTSCYSNPNRLRQSWQLNAVTTWSGRHTTLSFMLISGICLKGNGQASAATQFGQLEAQRAAINVSSGPAFERGWQALPWASRLWGKAISLLQSQTFQVWTLSCSLGLVASLEVLLFLRFVQIMSNVPSRNLELQWQKWRLGLVPLTSMKFDKWL